jgi:hypothetical protein
MMTPRERYKATVHFKKPDVLPWLENVEIETLFRWFGEGLPVDKVLKIELHLPQNGALLTNTPEIAGLDPTYFGCQFRWGCVMPVDVGPVPRFKQRVLREDDKYIDFMSDNGNVLRKIKRAEHTWYNMPMFVSSPVKDRDSWEEYKKRLNPNDPRRYPKDWERDHYIEVFESYQKGHTQLCLNGFYGFGGQIMGIPTFNVMFYKDPELIHDMATYWEFFTMETIRDAVETLGDRIDQIFWWEDLAEKHGPCISPKSYREFLLPHYKRVTSFLRKNKIDRIMMDCDGNHNALLDLIIEAGITGCWPLEVNSGMNAISIRKTYGNKLFLGGNLDKREIAKGGDAMRKEVDSKVPVLKELGGYFPSIDHMPSADTSLEKFLEYADYMKKQLQY